MGFIDENKHFIKIRLQSDFKGLDNEEKIIKYKSIRCKVIDRVVGSYKNLNDLEEKIAFYQELISVLGNFEPRLIYLNLFLEKDYLEIAKWMNDFTISSIKDNLESDDVIFHDIHENIVELIHESDRKENSYLNNIQKAINKRINTSDSDWDVLNDRNSVIHKFSNQFILGLSNPTIENSISQYFFFLKLWNSDNHFLNPFNNSKAILLYSKINNFLKSKILEMDFSAYLKFYQKVSTILDLIFVEINYKPLFDNQESTEYKNGYLSQRNIYKELIKTTVSMNRINIDLNYGELIEIYKDSNNNTLNTYIEQTVTKKIQSRQLPEDKDWINFKQFDSQTSPLKKIIYSKFYKFQYFNF